MRREFGGRIAGPADPSFLNRIIETFRGTREEQGQLWGEIGDAGFEVSWSRQHVRVDCRGMSGDDMNKFIEVAAEFDCALYDPQTGQRYDESS